MALTLLKLAGGIVAALVLAFLAYAVYYHEAPMAAPQAPLSTATVVVGTTSVSARVADTDASRAQGLSGTASLPEGQGMLFVFDAPGNYAFWMKDMNYNLDILWANASGTITTIFPDLAPSTYPQAFAPASPDALYVLEVPAGWAREHGVEVGDIMRIAR